MRWLTVDVPGDEDRQILLEKPGPPGMDDASAETVRELVTKGATGLGFILSTDDCRRDYEELKAKGVEFTEEPTEHFYGIDCGFRDPFGNNFRLTQPVEGEMELPEEYTNNAGGRLGVAVVDREDVAVRIREETLLAEARVDRLAPELDAAWCPARIARREALHRNSIGWLLA